jgi:hypothetical protein
VSYNIFFVLYRNLTILVDPILARPLLSLPAPRISSSNINDNEDMDVDEPNANVHSDLSSPDKNEKPKMPYLDRLCVLLIEGSRDEPEV